MKILNCDRATVIQLCNVTFDAHEIQPRIAELGVLKGVNAESLYRILKPEHMYLVDSWNSKTTMQIQQNNAHREWVLGPEASEFYYGGALDQQTTFDELLKETRIRFKHESNVTIKVAETWDGINWLASQEGQNKLNYVYLDAAHEFEAVYDDLVCIEKLLGEQSLLQLNDCCYSEAGLRSNHGVLEAVTRFIKGSNFIPVCLTNTDYSDLLLCRDNSPFLETLHTFIEQSNLTYFELPGQFLSAMKVKINAKGKTCMSFI